VCLVVDVGPGVIRSLRLRGCVLGQPGGLALAQTLRTSSSLRDVDFQSNFVGPRAGVALVTALRESRSRLQRLDLRQNGLGGGVHHELPPPSAQPPPPVAGGVGDSGVGSRGGGGGGGVGAGGGGAGGGAGGTSAVRRRRQRVAPTRPGVDFLEALAAWLCTTYASALPYSSSAAASTISPLHPASSCRSCALSLLPPARAHTPPHAT
jgi:hypothetical protein